MRCPCHKIPFPDQQRRSLPQHGHRAGGRDGGIVGSGVAAISGPSGSGHPVAHPQQRDGGAVIQGIAIARCIFLLLFN